MTVGEFVSLCNKDTTIRLGYLNGCQEWRIIDIEFEAKWFANVFDGFADLKIEHITPVNDTTIGVWVNDRDYEKRLKLMNKEKNEES